ncbi:hypothetical protein PACTADRAFT_77299 [Pachysolen tannophilus NRRL Y-2460]|uniref:Uncharacterized protein n=1 Tax=Pachysolen tannophilus NRRL Y-2460 TaxID=669874 RepID=A0A1E4TPV4_PACTA|nr:hypothetical protein PACTADRAFT_77299 [Pachysolen tannophilus NRRL Y-2460]
MSVTSYTKKGDELSAKDKYEEAIEQYGLALKAENNSFKPLYGRSICYQRLKQNDLAIKDLEKCLDIALERGHREKIALVYFRLAIVYFNINSVALSLENLNKAIQYGCNDPSLSIWKAKITQRAERNEEDQKKLVQQNINNTTELNSKSNVSNTQLKPRFDYYQSSESVTVDFFLKNVDKENLILDFQEDSVTILLKDEKADSQLKYTISPLFDKINVQQSTYRVLKTKIEITLAKETKGIKWNSLEKTGNESGSQVSQNHFSTIKQSDQHLLTSSYPTSSKKGKNWSEIKIDDEDDEKEEADADENAFFRQLYANADDDTRRAMMKSFIESNGTALSTNWETAKDEKYDINAPSGVTPKKWNS